MNKYNISAYGPILMLRTTKGQVLLDWLARPRRFWRAFANLGLPAMIIGMLAMFLLVLFIDYFLIMSFQTATVPLPSKLNEPRNIFLIPGINEYIPLEWGVIALIVTLVVHEFSHAILCKVEGIRVKSMGILVALLPIGGFAEPDDEQLLGKKGENNDMASSEQPKKVATRRERVRVLTAGVMANFVTAFIAFSLFFLLLGSISSVGDVMVTSVAPGSPADIAGVKENIILTQMDGKPITSAQDFLLYVKDVKVGTNVVLSIVENGVKKEINITTVEGNETKAGVKVFKVVKGSPAEAAGIMPDMTLVRIDETQIKDISDFVGFMNSTKQGQKVNIYLISGANGSEVVYRDIELAKYPDSDAKKGFLGISYAPEGAVSYSTGISVGQFPARDYLNMLRSIPSLLNQPAGWLLLFGLPIFGLAGEGFPGFSGVILNFYEPTGLGALLGDGTFWILNALMWIGWMNFYAGLFNCLPAVPLDGGHVFRDVMTSSLSRIFGDGERVEKISNGIVIVFAILILLSFVFVMLAPYAAHGF